MTDGLTSRGVPGFIPSYLPALGSKGLSFRGCKMGFRTMWAPTDVLKGDEVAWTQNSAVEPCGRGINKLAFAGTQREGEKILLGSGWAPSSPGSLEPGRLLPGHPPPYLLPEY